MRFATVLEHTPSRLAASETETLSTSHTSYSDALYEVDKRAQQHQFFAKQVAELTEIDDPIRVKLYSDVEAYGVHPLHVGTGRGSRKIYSFDDVLRIAVAERLSRFVFSALAIGAALGKIRASELDPENGRCLLVQARSPDSAAFDWRVLPHDEAQKWRREKTG